MKRVLTVLMLFLVATSCRKENSTGNTQVETDKTLYLLYKKTQAINAAFLKIGEQKKTNPKETLLLLEKELKNDTDFDDVYCLDSTYLYYKINGITQVFSLVELTDDGTSLYRGSAGTGSLSLTGAPGQVELLDNVKVLCFVPEVKYFYGTVDAYRQRVVDRLKSSKLNLKVTELYEAGASYSALKTFSGYGFVLIDSHGDPDGFMLGDKVVIDSTLAITYESYMSELEKCLAKEVFEGLKNGDLRLNFSCAYNPNDPEWWKNNHIGSTESWAIYITSQGVRNLGIDVSETIIMGNMCHSGYIGTTWYSGSRQIDPIQPAIMSLHPASYYAYTNTNDNRSQAVYNDFAQKCEDTLITSLFFDYDTTGSAHLFRGTTIPVDKRTIFRYLSFQHYGKGNYAFKKQVLTDPRDNKEYELVRIGDQLWMAENLRYAGVENYMPPGADEKDYGRFYTFKTGVGVNAQDGSYQQGVCPDGWHVPSRTDWANLYRYLGYPVDDNYFFYSGGNSANQQELATVKLLANTDLWEGWNFWKNKDSINYAGLNLKPDGRISVNQGKASYYNGGIVSYYSSSPTVIYSGTTYDYSREYYFYFGGFGIVSAEARDVNDPSTSEQALPCRCIKN